MAVCNLFNKLSKPTGNFLMFSQYVEDLTKCMTQNESYRVVPSKFIVADIDYANITIPENTDLNVSLPTLFQNYFENSCAYLRDYILDSNDGLNNNFVWSAETSKNLFWKTVIVEQGSGLFNLVDEAGTESKYNKYVKEIKYIGDINIQSYDEHDGMGYSEIFCHIPSAASCHKYLVNVLSDPSVDNHITYPENHLMGYNDRLIGNYSKDYYPFKKYDFDFENENQTHLEEFNYIEEGLNKKYEFNTIILLYDIMFKDSSNNWIKGKTCIPMGIYFTGNFNENKQISNTVTKFITDTSIYGEGSSYGLRICTRFTVTPESAKINIVDINSDNENNAAFCEAMSGMSECQSLMKDILDSVNNESEKYKNLYSIFKNSRTNVPYIKTIDNIDYWFVNGRLIGAAQIHPTDEIINCGNADSIYNH